MNADLSTYEVSPLGKKKEPTKRSNEDVLSFAFYSFLCFMCFEVIFAIMARSYSMLVDALAMSVDAFTYLFNLAAEKLKGVIDEHVQKYDTDLSSAGRLSKKKLLRLYLEFVPPFISIVCLMTVSIRAFVQSVDTLTNIQHVNDRAEEPNSKIMFLFSALNLVLDCLNGACFSSVQADNLWEEKYDAETDTTVAIVNWNRFNLDIDGTVDIDSTVSGQGSVQKETDKLLMSTRTKSSYASSELDSCTNFEEEHQNQNDRAAGFNLNMFSAYTHVMADTFRSIAVFMAATITFLHQNISPQAADASATIIVSVITAVSVIPLVIGLYHTVNDITELRRELQKEHLYNPSKV